MPQNRILQNMLDRLYASLISGPSLNCRPHASRQRVDLTAFTDLGCENPAQLMTDLLGDGRQCRVAATAPMPPSIARRQDAPFVRFADDDAEAADLSPEEKQAVRRWRAQRSLLTKLRNLSEDARIYEQDTGVPALNLGYPILSLPPNTMGGASRRILAPVAFIPVTLEVAAGRTPGVSLVCRGEGVDLITPNPALLAWIERETGKTVGELPGDDEGDRPWDELRALIAHAAAALELKGTDAAAMSDPAALTLTATPLAQDLPNEPAMLTSAVLGLFPASNQGLLRDTKAMLADDAVPPPVAPFIDVRASLAPIEHALPDEGQPLAEAARDVASERFVTLADPFQARAVARARTSRAVVIHGPPGTGKSQTITNIIADHLARGQRVLFVCDKRTALDVVANRLEHLELGRLCALVHDPQRDQRDLYMKIRAALEALPEVKTHPRAAARLAKADAELAAIHDELTRCHDLLMRGDEVRPSFHELIGQWLAIEAPAIDGLDDAAAATIDPAQLESQRNDIEVIFERAAAVNYAANPWSACAGIALDAYLARPMDPLRRQLASCVEDARAADATRRDGIPPFAADAPLAEQVGRRQKLAALLERAGNVDEAIRKHVASLDKDAAARSWKLVRDAPPFHDVLTEPLDTELALVVQGEAPNLRKLNEDIRTLERFEQSSQRWTHLLAFGLKRAAGRLLGGFGLRGEADDAARLRAFLTGLRQRVLLSHLARELSPAAPQQPLLPDADLTRICEGYATSLEAVRLCTDDTALAERVTAALADPDARAALADGLRRSEPRADALHALEQSMQAIGLFQPKWLERAAAQLRAGKQAGETLQRLQAQMDSLESVLRVHDGVAKLPAGLGAIVTAALKAGVAPDDAVAALRRAVLAGELRRRMEQDPALRQFDEQRVAHQFKRYRELEAEKRTLVRDVILHEWTERQRTRLLAGTGSRLNTAGADLRRRLFVRGKRAMRLRQMIAVGRNAENNGESDPLFEMCPIWMASPETVAQVFDREPVFDVVIFDEASQCRLEEALPVLTRAHRVVIAGDPKQLPPTRFFEAAFASSEDEELETDQDLFEAQQAEVEDLLAAALNLEVEEAYLDVHYRSRNADLIEFSNEHFYKQRLQAIPGHPRHRTRFPPLTLNRADGIYEDRCNRIEAERVVAIVDDLLKRADPPSIGIACFNLTQRDLIVDLLDDKAAEDSGFATRLAAARSRVGEGSFEGLFVKNLENVQGDERDHIIISTTYGPTKDGKFYRRFGPLGSAGGGRRLNVLVTRARHEVHLVTSIPREAYLSVAALPAGATPNGGWLLFAYLRYAEQLAELYEENHQMLERLEREPGAQLVKRPIPPVSTFAMAMADRLAAERAIGSDVHWGNPGFCIDLAVHHPTRAEDVTVGVLCDFARYDRAPDLIEWELYRQGIFDWTGWQTHRVWSPQFFRDPLRGLNQIDQASRHVADETPANDKA